MSLRQLSFRGLWRDARGTIAFGALTYCYVTSDFSVANVFENSHSQMPLIYKFTSVWGNHEGSMLLWVSILALFGGLVAAFGSNLPLSLPRAARYPAASRRHPRCSTPRLRSSPTADLGFPCEFSSTREAR